MKIILLTIGVLFILTNSAHAQEATAPLTLRIAQGAFVGLEVLDVHSTWTALGQGAREGNGWMAPIVQHRLLMPMAKATAISLAVGASEVLWRKGHRRTAVIGMLSLAAGYGVVVAHNYHVVTAQRNR